MTQTQTPVLTESGIATPGRRRPWMPGTGRGLVTVVLDGARFQKQKAPPKKNKTKEPAQTSASSERPPRGHVCIDGDQRVPRRTPTPLPTSRHVFESTSNVTTPTTTAETT